MTAEIYGTISFAPRIDALSKVLGKATGTEDYNTIFSGLCVHSRTTVVEMFLVDLEELSENNRGKHSREILRQKAELEESKECSFKYVHALLVCCSRVCMYKQAYIHIYTHIPSGRRSTTSLSFWRIAFHPPYIRRTQSVQAYSL